VIFLAQKHQIETSSGVITLVISAVVFAFSRSLIVPVLGIISCLYLRVAAWLNFGFVIYVGYGAVNSRLTGRHNAERPAEHDARTAYTGTWLAIIGVALLVFMRGFDVWLEALKAREEMSGLSKMTAALGDVLHVAPWLEVSWFLIVPLALNAFVLCPIVIARALKAGRDIGSEGQAGSIASTLIISIALLALTVIYLILLAMHNL
jgi:hypothetical protein